MCSLHGHIGVGDFLLQGWLILSIKAVWCFSFAMICMGKTEGETVEWSLVVCHPTLDLMTCRMRMVTPGLSWFGWLSKPAEGSMARCYFFVSQGGMEQGNGRMLFVYD